MCATRVDLAQSINLLATNRFVQVDTTRVAFRASVGPGGSSIFSIVITDGTAPGTIIHSMDGWIIESELAPMDDRIYFCARAPSMSQRRMYSVPLVAGTARAETNQTTALCTDSVVAVTGAVAWTEQDSTANTIRVYAKTATGTPVQVSNDQSSLDVAAAGGRFYFTQQGATSGTFNIVTVAGTTAMDLGTVPSQLGQEGTGGNRSWADVGGEFWAGFSTATTWEIRRYDASSLVDTVVMTRVGNQAPSDFWAAAPHLVFAATPPTGGGLEIFRSDGTTAGTAVLLEATGTAGSRSSGVAFGKVAPISGGGAFIRAANMPATLYRMGADGTSVTPVDLGGATLSNIAFASKDDALFFKTDFYAARTTSAGHELVRTTGGLRIQPNNGLFLVNGRIWFTGREDGAVMDSIWFVE